MGSWRVKVPLGGPGGWRATTVGGRGWSSRRLGSQQLGLWQLGSAVGGWGSRQLVSPDEVTAFSNDTCVVYVSRVLEDISELLAMPEVGETLRAHLQHITVVTTLDIVRAKQLEKRKRDDPETAIAFSM